MLYPFSALLARMKYITRWSLMHSTRAESLSEHTCDTALLAHFIDCERAFLSDAVGREGRVLRCLLRTQRLSRTCEIQQGQERADGYFAHCRAFSR